MNWIQVCNLRWNKECRCHTWKQK